MKLIDILVQELPKHGGWPVGVKTIEMHMDGDIFFDGDHSPDSFCLPQCDDGWRSGLGEYSNEVTREQYESALAASQPQWNGEGLPPVGMEIEYKFRKVKYRNDFSRGRVLAYGVQNVFMEHWSSKNEFIQPLDNIEFRPIRSEADKKRDEVTNAVASALYKDGDFDTMESLRLATFVYDAIAAGKIPYIQLK